MAAYCIGFCGEINIKYYEIHLHVACPCNDKMCVYYFVFWEWCKREGTNYIFALKENSVYNNRLSNPGCYEHIRPSLPSPGRLFAEAACSSETAQQALTIPIGIPALHLRCDLSLQDIHSPALTKLPASKGGL